MQIRPFPLAQWRQKTNDDAVGIDFRVLLESKRLLIAQLRFAENASFAAHDAPWDCEVLCLEGDGMVRVGEETAPIQAGQSVVWPKSVIHQLWTESSTMVTQMIEHRHEFADPAKAWQEHSQQRE